MTLPDQAQRLQALDTSASFILQAPAGSGKTELLTQRFLALLAIVKQAPEEVVAITFTRKAAIQMRTRIVEALHFAALHTVPTKTHALQTWQLAQEVLARDTVDKWNLLQNPNRLRILTIDALCSRIAKSAPIIADLNSKAQVTEDPSPLYKEAAQRLLLSLEENTLWVPALATLLLHLDNNYILAEKLFIDMLKRRDQWLAHVVKHSGTQMRNILEEGLHNLINDTLHHASLLFSPEDKNELITLARFAASHLSDKDETFIIHCLELAAFPSPQLSNLPIWLGIADLLLTKSYEWRQVVNKNCGFPAVSAAISTSDRRLFKSMKERGYNLLAKLSSNALLQSALTDILLLPPPFYSVKQWEVLRALTELLPILVAQLNIVFREHHVTDFITIASGAIAALGEADNPTDVALNLDYQIQHLLVDEFQDTSVSQYRLLELLTSGWEKNDGRTLFLVGDPMQSIYRFREAEVGIFLQVKKYGIGNIDLIPLTLEVNFRSDAFIVKWFNNTLQRLFPSNENIASGAIPFTSSVALAENIEHFCEVGIHPFFDPDEQDEAKHIADLIQQELNARPTQSIAILVRSRSHLQTILPALKKAQLNFQAVEIEKLINSEVVQDLLSLTKALLHTGNRIAWLAILRAPWCGVSLTDLHAITHHDLGATLWENLKNLSSISTISEEGCARIERIMPILMQAVNERSRANIRQYIEYTWYALGGPACLAHEHEIKNAIAYFELLDNFADQALIDFDLLQQKLLSSYTHITDPAAPIHVMTIHKAKGLEFDTVIIPALEKRPTLDKNKLLLSLERKNQHGQTDLILAPIQSLEEDTDLIYRYIKRQNTLQSNHEMLRLLYVAITRTKSRLHLLGSVYSTENATLQAPRQGSFLHLLWPAIHSHFTCGASQNHLATIDLVDQSNRLNRLALDWISPGILPFMQKDVLNSSHYQFNWQVDYMRGTGSVIHTLLQGIANNSNLIEIAMNRRYIEKKLIQAGISKQFLTIAADLVQQAMTNTLNDERGQWILSNCHLAAQNEYRVTAYCNNSVAHYVMDRTFIDKEGIRWIIDYKSSKNLDQDETSFMLRAKIDHMSQLENYARIMQLLDPRPIKLGLYFPLFSGWCEWEYVERK